MIASRQPRTTGKLMNTINRTNSNQGASAPAMIRAEYIVKIADSEAVNAIRCLPTSVARQSVVR